MNIYYNYIYNIIYVLIYDHMIYVQYCVIWYDMPSLSLWTNPSWPWNADLLQSSVCTNLCSSQSLAKWLTLKALDFGEQVSFSCTTSKCIPKWWYLDLYCTPYGMWSMDRGQDWHHLSHVGICAVCHLLGFVPTSMVIPRNSHQKVDLQNGLWMNILSFTPCQN